MEKTQEETKKLIYEKCTLSLLLSNLKNNIYLFTRKKLAESLVNEKTSIDDLIKYLEQIKNQLTILSLKNESKNLNYIENLTKTWDDFKKTCTQIDTNTETNSLIELNILSLIKNIEKYPKDLDLTLGYYLSEYNKEQWAPLPFMNILEALYNEHQKLLEKSTLSSWIIKTEELLVALSF